MLGRSLGHTLPSGWFWRLALARRVFTAADLNAVLGDIPMIIGPEAFDEVQLQGRRALAEGRVRHVGEPVAVVVAESAYAAQDAADLVEVEYAPLPVVTDPEAALAPDAPRLYEHLPWNLGIRWARSHGDVERAFREAPVVVEARLANQRLMAVALEPRGITAAYDAASGDLTVWGCTQIPDPTRLPRRHRRAPEAPARARARHRAAGRRGFGAKIALYPEDLVVPWLAMRLGRPVRWTASRREDLLATSHGRDVVARIRLAADRSGRILGLVARIFGNLGYCLRILGAVTEPHAVRRVLAALGLAAEPPPGRPVTAA